eukprot:TRINITY_DN5197_c0_g1_i1.p1 TRINITY_DN5197_c0_g1~~TRINITY_DN5197_c0_g1_i1.p1  ORF type:complete len:591 (+),score=177.67 TRINITY_DN5197_c0_g1_i1:64-1836(+)
MESAPQVRVKVALRVRPLLPKEIAQSTQTCLNFPGNNQITCERDGKVRSFTYDSVYSPQKTQQDLYRDTVEPLIDSCFEGFNTTILAYGQTGSGKTYTMGSAVGQSNVPPDQVGIIPRVIDRIFDTIDQLKANGKEYVVRVSFLELYKEDIKDMFCPDVPPSAFMIREDKQKGVYVTGITESEVKTRQQLINVLMVGSLYRTTAVTEMNAESSRSHAIFTIILQEVRTNITSKVHFVDLAGSERLARTKAEGAVMKEGISINSGLLALGNVINALGDVKKKTKHVPYRDSKLTRILQDSLGGNSRTLMIACASPASINFDETINTLKYADRARQIKNKPVITLDPVALELANLRKQVELLKTELKKYKEGGYLPNAQPQPTLSQDHRDAMTRMEEELEKLRKDNIALRVENERLESDSSQLRTRVLAMETQSHLMELARDDIESLDDRFQEMISRQLNTIDDLGIKLSKAESELKILKGYDPTQNVIPSEVSNALTYELDPDFNLTISASTQKLLDELTKSALFQFDFRNGTNGKEEEDEDDDDLFSTSEEDGVLSPPGTLSNGTEDDDIGVSSSTEQLLKELQLNDFAN